MNFTENYEVVIAGAAIALASDTDANTSIIDTKGYGSITFIASVADSVDTGVATFTVEQDIANADTNMSALSGATASLTSASNDDLNGQGVRIEVVNPQERYIQLVRTSTVANIAFGDVVAILSNPRSKPITEDSTISTSVLVLSPAES